MFNELTMQITTDEKGITIRLPLGLDVEEIQRFLDYLKIKQLTSKSQATQEDIDALSKEVKSSWWEKNRHKYIK
jgi:hypothetical protein